MSELTKKILLKVSKYFDEFMPSLRILILKSNSNLYSRNSCKTLSKAFIDDKINPYDDLFQVQLKIHKFLASLKIEFYFVKIFIL